MVWYRYDLMLNHWTVNSWGDARGYLLGRTFEAPLCPIEYSPTLKLKGWYGTV